MLCSPLLDQLSLETSCRVLVDWAGRDLCLLLVKVLVSRAQENFIAGRDGQSVGGEAVRQHYAGQLFNALTRQSSSAIRSTHVSCFLGPEFCL